MESYDCSDEDKGMKDVTLLLDDSTARYFVWVGQFLTSGTIAQVWLTTPTKSPAGLLQNVSPNWKKTLPPKTDEQPMSREQWGWVTMIVSVFQAGIAVRDCKAHCR